jgi:hypothetical protein
VSSPPGTSRHPRAWRAFALATAILAVAAAIALALALAIARPAVAAPEPAGPSGGGPSSGSEEVSSKPGEEPPKAPSKEGEEGEGEGAEKSEGADPNAVKHLGGESESHEFPLDNYGLDEQVQFGITHPGNIFDKVFQAVIKFIWEVMLYIFNGIMVMLTWAFSLNLTKKSMPKLVEDLQVLRQNIDTPWGLAAIGALSLWGIWTGLVRKKSIDTMRGLLASLLAMAAVMVVIGNPVGTLGQLTTLADGASTEMLNSITSGKVSEPKQAVRSTEKSLFNSVILRPWCALQFGDIKYCEEKPKGLNQTVANTWLQAPPESPWRTSLWQITNAESEAKAREEEKGVDPPGEEKNLGDMYVLGGHPDKVAMIGGGFVMPRLGLLLLIVIGLLGAIALFGYLAVKLLWAALMFLVLALFAPAMFLVAALGESGRATVVAWATRLLGAAVTKVIYALFLAVIVEGSNLITTLKLGFLPTWLVFIAFWWGVLLKRKDLLALLTLNHKAASPSGIDFDGAASGNALSQLYFGSRLAGGVGRKAARIARGATAAPRFALRRGSEATKRATEASRVGKSEAGRQLAQEELEREGRETVQGRNTAEHSAEVAKGSKVLGLEKKLKLGLAEKDREIAGLRTKHGGMPRTAEATRLQDERAALNKQLIKTQASPGYKRARSVPAKPREASDRDVQTWIEGRRSELAEKADSPKNLRAAGIDPEAHKRAGKAEQDVNREMSQQRMARHESLLDRAGVGHSGDEHQAMGRRERRQVRAEAREGGHEDHYRSTARQRAKRHRQNLRNDRRSDRRRRRNVR